MTRSYFSSCITKQFNIISVWKDWTHCNSNSLLTVEQQYKIQLWLGSQEIFPGFYRDSLNFPVFNCGLILHPPPPKKKKKKRIQMPHVKVEFSGQMPQPPVHSSSESLIYMLKHSRARGVPQENVEIWVPLMSGNVVEVLQMQCFCERFNRFIKNINCVNQVTKKRGGPIPLALPGPCCIEQWSNKLT